LSFSDCPETHEIDCAYGEWQRSVYRGSNVNTSAQVSYRDWVLLQTATFTHIPLPTFKLLWLFFVEPWILNRFD